MTSKKLSKEDDWLNEKNRAEDIILGALGYGQDAKILNIKKDEYGFQVNGEFSDGEKFQSIYQDELSKLEMWAILILQQE